MTPSAQPLVDLVRRVLAERGVAGWLVGGIVRDALLGRDTADVDVLVDADAHTAAEWLLAAARAEPMPSHTGFACLDQDWGVYRVVIGDATIDVVPLEGSLEEELLRRDITINALAVPIGSELADIIDVSGGLPDLAARVARTFRSSNLSDDPVRLLRVARFAVELDLTVEPQTAEWVRGLGCLLGQAPGERIARELLATLDSPRAAALPEVLEGLGLADAVLPELASLRGIGRFGFHHLDAYEHSMETYAFVAAALSGESEPPGVGAELWSSMIEVVSGEPLPGVRARRAIVLLAALLHDVGKPSCMAQDDDGRVRFVGHERAGGEIARQVAARLRLSRLETAHLAALAEHHMRPCMLGSTEEPPTARACARVFRLLLARTPDVCLLALADRAASRGPASTPEVVRRQMEATARVLELWLAERKREPEGRPLVTGRDLMTHLGISGGPIIGRILTELGVAEAAGELHDRDAALALARELMADMRSDGPDGGDA